MKFEEQFPSLKGKDRPHPTFGLHKKIIEEYDVFYAKTIKEHCLDKAKVEEAIDKHIFYCCECGCTFGKDKLKKELGLK